MNRVTNRAWIMLVFILILVGGTVFFMGEYAMYSDQWVVFPNSPHVYNKTNLGCGIVTDRFGTVLLDTLEDRVYADDSLVRQSTLHWLGDRKGNIQADAISRYAKEMVGFDMINGIYSYGGTGGTAVLTLSSEVQAAALEAMAGRKGTVAVYNYKTGEILCAVTTPTFDPDNVTEMTGEAFEGVYLNRVVQSTYPPGSIFKIVTTAVALNCVPDILDRTFTCTGRYQFTGGRVTCERAHGTLDLQGAMAKSCNCCFAQIAQLIGRRNMLDYVETFQITDSITFDGVTTAKGNYDVSDSSKAELAWSCIGQHTDLINPARYMTFMGAIAGGGVGAEPYLVSSVTAGDTVTYRAKTVMTDRLMSKETADTLRDYMRNNVMAVYGANHFPGLTGCAKSGTSELGGGQTPNAMFTGFVADEAYPLAFIVVVENGGYGSATCVPILSKVLASCKTVMDRQ